MLIPKKGHIKQTFFFQIVITEIAYQHCNMRFSLEPDWKVVLSHNINLCWMNILAWIFCMSCKIYFYLPFSDMISIKFFYTWIIYCLYQPINVYPIM